MFIVDVVNLGGNSATLRRKEENCSFITEFNIPIFSILSGRNSYKPYSNSQRSNAGKSSRSRRSRDDHRAGPYSTSFEPASTTTSASSAAASSSSTSTATSGARGSKRHHRSSTSSAPSSSLTAASASAMGGSVSSKFRTHLSQ